YLAGEGRDRASPWRRARGRRRRGRERPGGAREPTAILARPRGRGRGGIREPGGRERVRAARSGGARDGPSRLTVSAFPDDRVKRRLSRQPASLHSRIERIRRSLRDELGELPLLRALAGCLRTW